MVVCSVSVRFCLCGEREKAYDIDISSLSAFLGTPQYQTYFNNPSDVEQGGITASMSGGSFLGALAAGFLSDHVGRRHAIQVASVIWVIGSSISSASQNVAMLIAGRYVVRLKNVT